MESSVPNEGPEGKGDLPNRANRAYKAKFKEMRKYIPFLDKMIARLHGSNGSAREGQLAKMKSLYAILNNDGNHRLTLQSLEKCDSILRNLYQKVQGEEEEELMLQSKNKDGKTLPPTNSSKAKENEPNPHWVLGASQKPPTGFKKNLKNQKLAHVKAPGHAHVPQSIANRSLRVDKPVQSKETSKHLTKSPPKMSDRKSEKTKAKENKGESKAPPTPSPKENINVNDSNKSKVNESVKPASTTNADQKKLVGKCTLAPQPGNSTASNLLDDHQRKLISNFRFKPTMTVDPSKGSSQPLKSDDNPVKKTTPTVLSENKSEANTPSVTPVKSMKSDESSTKYILQKKSPPVLIEKKDTRSVTPVKYPMKSDESSTKYQLQKMSPPVLREKKDTPSVTPSVSPMKSDESSTNLRQKIPPTVLSEKKDTPSVNPSVSPMKSDESSTNLRQKIPPTVLSEKKDTPSVNPSVSPMKSDESSTNLRQKIPPTVLSEKKDTPSVNPSVSPMKSDESSTNLRQKIPPTVLSEKKDTPSVNPSVSPMKSDESSTNLRQKIPPTVLSEKKDTPSVNPSVSHMKSDESSTNLRQRIPPTVLSEKKDTPSVNPSVSPMKSEESSTNLPQKIPPTVLNENKCESDLTTATHLDQNANKRPVPLVSPKDPRLARGLLRKSLCSERLLQPTIPLQENVTSKPELRQEYVQCKTVPKEENAPSKSEENVPSKCEPTQSQSLRAKLAEEITTVHKVGASVGGALRILKTSEKLKPKSLHSIEQNRIANLKPGTIMDLMNKEAPKKSKLSNPISDQQKVKTNQSTLSSMSKEELEKIVVENIHNLPTLPPDTIQILERLSAKSSSQGNPGTDQAVGRFDSSQTLITHELPCKPDGGLGNSDIVGDQNSFASFRTSSEICNRTRSGSNDSNQVTDRFDQSHNSRSNNYGEEICGSLSRLESHAFDTVAMPSQHSIQSPSYNQSNFSHDISSGNSNRNVGKSFHEPQNDHSQNYFNRDNRRLSQERSPEADEWQRVREDRLRFANDSVYTNDSSGLYSRYRRENCVQNSNQYGRTSLGRRPPDRRFSPERTPGRYSHSRSSLDYPEDRSFYDSTERRTEARFNRHRDFNESFSDRSDLEHNRAHSTRSSYERSFCLPSADRFNSDRFPGRSRMRQERFHPDDSNRFERSVSRERNSDDRYPKRSFSQESSDRHPVRTASQERVSSDSRTASSQPYHRDNRRDTYVSPLDHLYSDTRGPITGRGYGVQNYRFKSKENENKPQRKFSEKNKQKITEHEHDSNSPESKVHIIPKEIDSKPISKFVEKTSSSNILSCSSTEISNSREKSTDEREIEVREVAEKSHESVHDDPDEIPISFVEERKVVLLLDESDVKCKKQDKNNFSSKDNLEKSEVDGCNVKSKFEKLEAVNVSRLSEGSDESSQHKVVSQAKEKHFDSSTTSGILGDGLVQTKSVSNRSENEKNLNEPEAPENENLASNVDRESIIPGSALEKSDNIAISSPKKSKSIDNDNDKMSQEKNKNSQAKDSSSIAEPSLDRQKNKEKELVSMNAMCLDNINTDQALEKNDDDSIVIIPSNESDIPIKEESQSDIKIEDDSQLCKVEEICVKEEGESSDGISKTPVVDFFMQTEEGKMFYAKYGVKISKKIHKIQMILDEDEDEEEVSEFKIEEEIKPEDVGAQNNECKDMSNIALTSNKSDDASSNKLTETTKKLRKCTRNQKKTRQVKGKRPYRRRLNTKLKAQNVESSTDLKKGKRNKSELDKLHDGLREMFLKTEIEKTSGIRSCRLRNSTATNQVDKSPDVSNRNKLQKESTKDQVEGGKNIENKDKKIELDDETAQVESKDSELKISESNSSNKENKEGNDDLNKLPSVSKVTEDIDHQQNNCDKQKKEEELIKSILSSSSLKSTPIVLLQKSNVLMKPKSCSSTSNTTKQSVVNKSEVSDKVAKELNSTAKSLTCEKSDASLVCNNTVETHDSPVPKNSRKKQSPRKMLNIDESVSQQKPLQNPVIILEKNNSAMIESACQSESQNSSSNKTNRSIAHDSNVLDSVPPILEESDKNGNLQKCSIESEASVSSNAEIGKVGCRKRASLEYSELANIFTDKSYFLKSGFGSSVKEYDCKICSFYGKPIVKHYVTEHSDQDVLISRLNANDAKEAIMKSKNVISIKPSSFQCYICSRQCTHVVSFHDHVTSHTGEYRYKCKLCELKTSNRDAMKTHCTVKHKLDWKSNSKTAIEVDPLFDTTNVFGYICSECYFVQLKKSTVEEHVKNHHSGTNDVKVIRINMSSLEATPAQPALNNNIDSSLLDSITPIPSVIEVSNENLPANASNTTIQENRATVVNDGAFSANASNTTIQENRTTVVNDSAFSCVEPDKDFTKLRCLMKDTLQNIGETLFRKEQTVSKTISGKIGDLHKSWKYSPENESISSGPDENLPQEESEAKMEISLESLSIPIEEEAIVDEVSSAADEDMIEQQILEEELSQVEETAIEEEILLAKDNEEQENTVELESSDAHNDSPKIVSLITKYEPRSDDSEEENSSDNTSVDDFDMEDLQNEEMCLLNLVCNADTESAVISKVDLGPLTISRSNKSVTFSCNISSCHFTSENPKYILCHFGKHLALYATLDCSICKHEFDCSLGSVLLLKGIVRHGLEHMLPSIPTLPQSPTQALPAGEHQQPPSRTGMIRVRRLSGDKLSTFVDNSPVAGPSFVQDQPSTSSNFFGNLRIESVVSATNCDAETRQTIMNSLHNEPSRKRPREQYELATVVQHPTVEFLINFYKCMGVNCHFSSNLSTVFLDHLKNNHPVKASSASPWFHCAYCDVKASCRTALVKHMKLYHCHSNKQCAYCNYRSYSYNNVMYHHDIVHVDKILKIYNCKYVEPLIPPPDMPNRTDVILPYRCMFGDGRDGSSCYYSSSFVWDVMERHLSFHGYNGHKCYICLKPVLLAEMYNHYFTSHMLGLYQCTYCMFAAPTGEVMRAHLSGTHPDLKPQALKREFKPDAFPCLVYRNMPLDVELDKLTIVNFEDLWVPIESVIDGELMVPTSIETASATVGTQLSEVAMTKPIVYTPQPRTKPTVQTYRILENCFPKNPPKPAASHASQSTAATRVVNNEPEIPPFALWPKTLKPRIVKRSRPPPTIDNEVIEISSSPERERSPERDSKIILKDSIKPKKETIENEVIEISSSSETESDIEIDPDIPHMCFLCNKIFYGMKKALHHITTEHRVNKTTIVKHTSGRLVRAKIVTSDSPMKPFHSKKKFTMNEIHLLPKKAILNSPILCEHCGFSNVVVKNLKIHLQNHASGKEVANKLLVNPVPCLETNEKMFDKMVNLAGSSHSQTAKNVDLKHVFEPPKFVDPFIRYSCDVCNHLTLNDENLLYHVKNIHNTSHFKCMFCQDVAVPVDKMLNHLKMHDRNLYKCPYCNLCHWQRSQVERHVTEKHREKKPLVLIVRDLNTGDEIKTNEEAVQPEGLKISQWQCASCETIELQEAAMKEHCKTVHGVQEWCKCCLCDFVSDDDRLVIKHFKQAHQRDKLHVAHLYYQVYKNLPSFDTAVDMGLPRRRTRNLRDNIRGHILSENLKVADVHEPGTYKCPTCLNYTSKSKSEFIRHMWDDYGSIAPLAGTSSAKNKKQYETYINSVIWRQEIDMKAVRREVSGESSKDSDSTNKDPPRLKRAYRKRSATKGSATSEKNKVDSDDTNNSKKPRCGPEKEHTCTLCSFQCLDSNALKDHMDKRHPSSSKATTTVSQPNDAPDEVIYECQLCGRVDYKNALLQHFTNTHPVSSVSISLFRGELFKCNICNMINPSYERLMSHSTSVHLNCPIDIAAVEAAKNTQCVKSPEISNTRTNNARTFACSLCKDMFNTHTACRTHVKNQHGSKAANIVVMNEQPEKIPVAKKSTSKSGDTRVPDKPTDKVYLSQVILKDLRESH